MIESALKCLNRGWSVFPLIENTKKPATPNGFKDASKSIEDVRRWWSRWSKANIGIATGQASGVTVVDIDVKKDKSGVRAKGRESLVLIKGLCPLTYTVTTTTGGWHLYYRSIDPVRSRNGFLPGIDIKSDGGYVVGPGSMIDGREYQEIDCSVAPLSPILKLEINRQEISKPVKSNGAKSTIEIVVGPHNWHKPILRAVGYMVRRGYGDGDILAKVEQYTMPGYSSDDTRREVQKMIDGARRKGWDRK